jgi:hypothetical protein
LLLFTANYQRAVSEPKEILEQWCLGRLKTAEKQRKNSKPSALEALSKHNMSSRIYQAINANIARNGLIFDVVAPVALIDTATNKLRECALSRGMA